MKNERYESRSLLSNALILVGVIGIFFSHHVTGLVLQGGGAIVSACSGNSLFDCGKTLGSSYGKIFGVPLSFFATVYFGWIVYHLVSNRLWSCGESRRHRAEALCEGGWRTSPLVPLQRGTHSSRKGYRRIFALPYRVSLIAVGVCLVFAYISFFVLRTVCLYCLGLSGLVALALVLSYWGIQGARARAEREIVLDGVYWYGRNWKRHSALVMTMIFSVEMILPAHVLWAMRTPLDRNQVVFARDAAQNQLHIVKFTDFECPACQRGAMELEKLKEKYPDQIQIEVVNFPLSNIHPLADLAAKVGIVMKQKGKFEEYYIRMMLQNERLTEEKIDRVITELKEDVSWVKNQAVTFEVERILVKDIERGRNLEVHSTPTLIVNGEKLAPGVGVAKLESIILEKETNATVVDGIVNKSIHTAFLSPQSKSIRTLADSGQSAMDAGSSGNVIQAASCSQVDVQAAIDAAADGDTVKVPAGTCTWTRSVNIGSYSYSTKTSTTKSLILQGDGIDRTIIYDSVTSSVVLQKNAINLFLQAGKNVRITGFTFDGTGTLDNYAIIGIGGDVSNHVGVRVDHCKFQNVTERGINISQVYGLIDHNTFIRKPDGANPTLISMSGDIVERTGNPNDSWARSQDMGTAHAVYMEDNIFIHNINANGPFDAYEGARYVFRHNQVYGNNLGHHGYDSSLRGIVNFEIYDNTFRNASPTGELYKHGIVFEFRSGSGVIFNNTIIRPSNANSSHGFYDAFALLRNYRSDPDYINNVGGGPCNGSNPNDGNQDSSGYPCKDQIGRSSNQTLSPVYGWNNNFQGTMGGNLSVGEHGTNTVTSTYHVLPNRDFYNGVPKPGYVPYTYPHPLSLTGFLSGTGIIEAASCSHTDVQTAINSAQDGDTVKIPAGTCTWSTQVTVPSTKALTIQGAGQNQTVIVHGAGNVDTFSITVAAGKFSRVTGVTFDQNHLDVNGRALVAFKISSPDAFRIDHVTFQNIHERGIWVLNGTQASQMGGLIDHNKFYFSESTGTGQAGSSDLCDAAEVNLMGFPLGFGGANFIFFENNELFTSKPQDGSFEGYGCSRVVERFNVFHGFGFGHHGTDSGNHRGVQAYEYYHNTIDTTGMTVPWSGRVAQIRSGNGFIFNNTLSSTVNGGISYYLYRANWATPEDDPVFPSPTFGLCDGTSSWDGNQGSGSTAYPAAGYPCIDSPGWYFNALGGNGGTYEWGPNYAFGNRRGGAMFVAGTNNPLHIKEDVEYFNEKSPFNGTSGVGMGTKAQMNAITPTLLHAGFWVTDEGEWNSKNGSTPDGCLYIWNGSAWNLYYTPYTYPHPLILEETTPPGSTFYVSNSGSPACSDSPSYGSETQPWCTITYGVSRISGGDTLYVKAGTYNENLYINRPAGTSSKHTVIKAYPGHTVILRGNGVNTGRVKITGTSFLTLDGFMITNYNQGLFIEASNNILIQNCDIHHVGQEGLHINQNSSYITVQNCAVHDTRQWQYNGEGIYAGTGSAGPLDNSHHIIIRNNTIYNTTDEAIELKPGTYDSIVEGNHVYNAATAFTSAGVGAIEINEANLGVQTLSFNPNHIVRNNIIHDSHTAIRLGTGSTAYNNVIYNISSPFAGIYVNNSNGDNYTRRIYHNTIDVPSSRAVMIGSGVSDVKNNIGPSTSGNLATADSYYVNKSGADYHLLGGSGPIDVGANLTSTVPFDIEGVSRSTNPPDLGAYEYEPPVTDSDSDGLLDAWEILYFGSIADPRAIPGADPDGDGLANLAEQSAGTSPVDNSSRLVIVDQRFLSSTSFRIQWKSIVDKTYEVQVSTNLIGWSTVTNVTASTTNTTWTDSSLNGSGKKFYRIKIP